MNRGFAFFSAYKQKPLINKGFLPMPALSEQSESNGLPSPQFIITIEDWEYMAGLREKVSEIKGL